MANGRIVSNSGKLLQPHNFVRGSGDKQVPVLMQGDATLVDLIHGNPLAVLAKSMRAIICAPKGKRFVAADFSQIEARVTAWIAGQEDTLEMFRVYDRGEGPGIYEVSASGIYGCPVKDIDEEDPRRQTGKTATLACGFGGGVSALAKMAANYAIDMATAFPGLWATTDEATRERAMKRYEECLARSDSSADVLTEMAWLACELTKIGWRAANPKIVSSWKALDNAAIEAVLHPGTQVQAVHVDHDGHPTELLPVTFRTAFGYLWMRLPSGRCLAYPAPRCEMVTVPWADLTQPLDKREKRLAVTVLGVGQNNQFVRYALYPGLTVQHAVQATARDLMAAGMLRAEAHGYPIVLTVHDEVLAEMAHGEGDLEEFKRLLCVPQQWTTGLPIAASGWEGPRFRK
jgi:DNA polymerase